MHGSTKRAFKGILEGSLTSSAIAWLSSLHFILPAICEHAGAPTTSFVRQMVAIPVSDFLLDSFPWTLKLPDVQVSYGEKFRWEQGDLKW